jgi:hypothetical protein
MISRNLLVALTLLVSGYAVGAWSRSPAEAHDGTHAGKVEDLLREIARAQASQSESLRTIARSSERCSK